MPGGDGTGPGGMGPMTGRAAGFCAGYGVPGYANPVGGRGFGGFFGRGRGGGRGGGGRGWRNRFYATGLTGWQRAAMGPVPYATAAPFPAGGSYPAAAPAAMNAEQELQALKGQAEYFEDALDGIRKRIEELEAADKNG